MHHRRSICTAPTLSAFNMGLVSQQSPQIALQWNLHNFVDTILCKSTKNLFHWFNYFHMFECTLPTSLDVSVALFFFLKFSFHWFVSPICLIPPPQEREVQKQISFLTYFITCIIVCLFRCLIHRLFIFRDKHEAVPVVLIQWNVAQLRHL